MQHTKLKGNCFGNSIQQTLFWESRVILVVLRNCSMEHTKNWDSLNIHTYFLCKILGVFCKSLELFSAWFSCNFSVYIKILNHIFFSFMGRRDFFGYFVIEIKALTRDFSILLNLLWIENSANVAPFSVEQILTVSGCGRGNRRVIYFTFSISPWHLEKNFAAVAKIFKIHVCWMSEFFLFYKKFGCMHTCILLVLSARSTGYSLIPNRVIIEWFSAWLVMKHEWIVDGQQWVASWVCIALSNLILPIVNKDIQTNLSKFFSNTNRLIF